MRTPDLTWISAQDLIAEVKNRLPMYFQKGSVDESILYPAIQICLSTIGLKYNSICERMVSVDNYKANLPDNFLKLCYAVLCTNGSIFVENPNPYIKEEKRICELDICEKKYPCNQCTDDCGNIIKIKQVIRGYNIEYTNFEPIRVTNNNLCDSGCPNLSQYSPYEIFINGETIDTNFKDGYLFLTYYSKAGEEDDLYIPEHAAIKEWIILECIHKVFQYLYYNGEDVLQRYQLAQKDSSIAKYNAVNIMKPETYQFYDFRNHLYNRSKRYDFN